MWHAGGGSHEGSPSDGNGNEDVRPSRRQWIQAQGAVPESSRSLITSCPRAWCQLQMSGERHESLNRVCIVAKSPGQLTHAGAFFSQPLPVGCPMIGKNMKRLVTAHPSSRLSGPRVLCRRLGLKYETRPLGIKGGNNLSRPALSSVNRTVGAFLIIVRKKHVSRVPTCSRFNATVLVFVKGILHWGG